MDAIYRLHSSVQYQPYKFLASYIPQSEIEITMRGELPRSPKSFYSQVLKATEKEFVTPQDFAKLKNTVKTQNKEIIASNTSKLQEIFKEGRENISKELGTDFAPNVSKTKILNPHYESSNTLSYSMYVVSKVSSMREQTDIVVAGTFTLINVSGKVFLYSVGEKTDLEWTQKASQAWANKAISSNLQSQP